MQKNSFIHDYFFFIKLTIFLYIANTGKQQTFTAHTVNLLYKLAETYHTKEQINRLLVVIHHKKIHELASLRFLKLNLEYQKIKMERTYEHLFCFLSGDYVLNQHHQPDTKFVSIAAVVFKKQLIIALLGLKTLQ